MSRDDVNPKILGGIVVERDHRYDTSVRHNSLTLSGSLQSVESEL